MAGIGDSWGTKEELLHPRGPNGRWIRKAGVGKGIIQAVLNFLANFRPRTFQNKNQSTQYLHNISRRQGRGRMSNGDLRRLHDLPNVNEDLQDGVIDNPSTQQFVDMMDRTETELPDDLIVTTILPTEAFGFSAQTATGTDADTDPGIRGVSGKLGADRGYMPTVIGNPDESVPVPAGSVRLIIAAKKGTKVNIPGGSSSDPTLFLTRGQPFRITKIKPDGAGGWHMYASIDEARTPGEIPTPVGGPRGLQRPPTSEREAAIRDLERIQGAREGRPDEVAEQADIEARRAKADANAQETPIPSPQQEAERRRVEALPQQPAAGEPPPRTEPVVGRVGEPGAPGTEAPAPTVPEAPAVPRRSVDLRLAVRDAKVPSPSTGPRRKAWNEAYLGVTGGKKDPIDAVRELDADIATLRRGEEVGRGEDRGGSDTTRESDTDALQQLRDVIAKEYGLEPSPKDTGPRTEAGLPKAVRPEPVKTKLSKREQEAEERNRAAGASEAVPAPTPAKKAPAKKAAKKAAGGPVRTKDQEDRILSQASKLSGPPRNDEERRILDEAAEISTRRQGGITARRQAGTSTEQESPMKALAPGDDLDKMTKQQLLDEAARRDVTVPKSWTKDKIKAALRDEGFRRPEKKTPAARKRTRASQQDLAREFEQRQAQGEGEPQPSEADLDKMTKAQLIAEAGRRGVTARESWNKDRIKKAILDREKLADESDEQFRREMREELDAEFEDEAQLEKAFGEPEPPPVAKKAAKKAAPREPFNAGRKAEEVSAAMTGAPGRERVEQGMKAMDGLNMTQLRQVSRELGISPPRREQKESQSPEALREFIARNLDSFGTPGTPAPAPAKKAAKAAAPKRMTIGEARRLSAMDAIRDNEVTGSESHVWEQISRNVENGEWSVPKARQEAKRAARYWRESATTVRRGAGRSDPEKVEAAASRIERQADKYDKLAEDLTISQSVTKTDKYMGRGPDKVEVARARQAKIDEARGYESLGAEIYELVNNEATPEVMASRIRSRGKREGLPEDQIDLLARTAEGGTQAGHFNALEKQIGELLRERGIQFDDRPGAVVPYNPREHELLTRGGLPEGITHVEIVRPGGRTNIDGEDVHLERARVHPATPEERRTATKATQLVPEGSVPGTRTDAPVDNAPRQRELRKAWIEADIQAPPGPGRKSQEEIKGDLLAGRITPEEAIRRFESEIAFTNDDLTEVEAHLRESDLSDAERAKVLRHRDNLLATREAHEAQSEFLRRYFKDEAPVVSLKEAKVQDPVSYEFLKDATPDDMREAAKEAGLDAPSGDTTDEMFTDLLKQVAKNELDRRAAKKAAKKAPAKAAKKAAPAVPAEKERVDARLLAEGLDLDDEILDMVQRGLDGESVSGTPKNPTPRQLADAVDGHARARSDSTAIRFGNWDKGNIFGNERDPEQRAEMKREWEEGMARSRALKELAERLRGTRRKSAKKAAPSTPEVAKLQDKVDDLEKRRIDDALGELTQSGDNRDRADAVLEGLTLPELRRLAEQSGIPTARTKRGLRDNILDRFVPEQQVTLDQMTDLPSREAAHEVVGKMNKQDLLQWARELSIPGAGGKNMTQLRREIVEATTGRRLDSIATRGFTGLRPGLGDVAGRPDLPTEIPTPAAPRPKSLGVRTKEAGIDHPGRTFSDVDSAVGEADRRLQGGESPTVVSRFLRERAARVAKADINEEGRRFPVEIDKETLLSIRKSNAEYLRRVATHVQQEARGGAKARKATPEELAPSPAAAKKAAPSAPGAPSPSRTGTSPVGGTKSTAPEIKNRWGAMGTGGEIEFHPDGVVGNGIKDMGEDRLMDVDGEPLSNKLGKLVTRMNHGEISMDQFIAELKRLAERLPEGSKARQIVERMGPEIDAPKVKLDIPEGTPDVLARLARAMADNPLARGKVDRPGFRRDAENSELAKIMKMIEDFNAGRLAGVRMNQELQRIRSGVPHEANEGNAPILRALSEAVQEITRIMNDPELRQQLARRTPGAAKKATPRLTAIPGGGSGGGTKKRPKLTVVRNENGEFSFIWGEGDDDHVRVQRRAQQPSDIYAGSTV